MAKGNPNKNFVSMPKREREAWELYSPPPVQVEKQPKLEGDNRRTNYYKKTSIPSGVRIYSYTGGNWFTVIFFWFAIGLLWAGLYNFVYVTIPSIAPLAVTEGIGTWNILTAVWFGGSVLIAIVSGLVCLNGRKSIYGGISVCIILFACWLMIMTMWAILYNPVIHIIPNAFAAAFPASCGPGMDCSGGYATALNDVAVFLMLGFGFVGLAKAT